MQADRRKALQWLGAGSLATTASALGLGLGLGHARAQSGQSTASNYPSRPVRLVVPYPPGGATDVLARALGEPLGKLWQRPVIVENRPGVGGMIGADVVAKAAPDGYTLLLGGIGALTIHPNMMSVPYDPVNDFIPISLIATNDVVIVINPKLPPKNVAEFLAYCKANSGKLQYGSSGIGAPTHLAAELFKTRARADWEALFAGSDACVSPVLSMDEAPHHPHNRDRGAFISLDGVMQPAPAPRFERAADAVRWAAPARVVEAADVVREWRMAA